MTCFYTARNLQFVEKATGETGLSSSAGLEPFTRQILEYRVSLPSGSEILLVDTPGFDSEEEETHAFKPFAMILNWWITMYVLG